MPEGYNRVRDSIIPSDWKQYCLGELGKNKNGLNFHREDKGIKIRILGVGDFGNLSVLRDLNALSEISKSKTNAKTTKRNFFILWINQKIPAN